MHPRVLRVDRRIRVDAFSSFLRSNLLSLGIYCEYIHCKNDGSNIRNRWSTICDITAICDTFGATLVCVTTDTCRISIYNILSPKYTNYFIMTENHRFFSLLRNHGKMSRWRSVGFYISTFTNPFIP